jgi:DNA polymerase-3 subunit epsilon/oligoribonuclease
MLGIFLDLETTGLDPNIHCPIDLAFKVLDLESGEFKGGFQSIIKQPKEAWEHCDPVSIEINGYTWEQIEKGSEPQVVSQEIILLLNTLGVVRRKAVFICQNPAFDRAFFTQIISVYTQEKLNWPYHWLDLASMYWTRYFDQLSYANIAMPAIVNLSKNAIAAEYQIPPEEKPHRAMNGVEHLIVCYRAVLKANW